jgi:hypothetical protein
MSNDVTTGNTKRRRHEEDLTAFALVALLALFAIGAAGGIIFTIAKQPGNGLEPLLAVTGIVLLGGVIAMIVYILQNPLGDPRPQRRKRPQARRTR